MINIEAWKAEDTSDEMWNKMTTSITEGRSFLSKTTMNKTTYQIK